MLGVFEASTCTVLVVLSTIKFYRCHLLLRGSKLKKWEAVDFLTPSIDSGNPVEGRCSSITIIFVLILIIILWMQKDVVVIFWCFDETSGKEHQTTIFIVLSSSFCSVLPTFHEETWAYGGPRPLYFSSGPVLCKRLQWSGGLCHYSWHLCEVLKWSICNFQINQGVLEDCLGNAEIHLYAWRPHLIPTI